jgi:ABC-type Mn2+/Zn2+ transport system ATPase subunit
MSDPLFPYSRGRHADPDPDSPALATDRLSVCYPGTPRLALREVSIRAERGTRVALVGPNGAGKSTLLKAVAGLLPVASGDVRVYGNPVGACHHRVAYLPQRGDIDWSFPIPVSQFVLTGRYVHLGWFRRPGKRDREIAVAVTARLGLGPLADRQIGRLSGGQQQRALLARALAQEADLLLLDEPLNAVDAETRDVIYAVMAALRSEGKTLLVATHDLGRLADVFDSAVYLHAGELVAPPAGAFCGAHCCAPVAEEASWAG